MRAPHEVRKKGLASPYENDGWVIKLASHSTQIKFTCHSVGKADGKPRQSHHKIMKNILRCQKLIRFTRFGSKVCILDNGEIWFFQLFKQILQRHNILEN